MTRERPNAHPRRLVAWVVLGLSVAALLLGTRRYLPFVADDALISLRYARRLLDGHGLSWTDGERAEGYSNLLWVLLCAGLGASGLDLIAAARLLGLLCGGATLAAVVTVARPGGWAEAPRAAIPALALALSGPFVVWSIGGLEQPLVAALLAWAVALTLPLAGGQAARAPGAGLCLAGLCWTRPDGPLFTVALAAAVLIGRGLGGWRVALRLALPSAVAVLAQLAFRLAWHGDWVPNTARAKAAFSPGRLLEGLGWVGEGLGWLGGMVLLGAIGLALSRAAPGARGRRAALLLPLLGWCAWVASVGGDIFPARRHLVPALALLALLGAEGLRADGGRRRGALALATLALPLTLLAQLRDLQNARAVTERWEWDGQVVGTLLKTAFGAQRPLLAVDPAGTVPYFSELPSLDLLGLNDQWLGQHPPADLGTGFVGHELGDGAYTLSRAPDLVLLCTVTGSAKGCFRGGKELLALPEFQTNYRLIGLEGREPWTVRTRIWARVEGGPIGVRRAPGRVSVPGWLLGGGGLWSALDAEGRLRLSLPAGAEARLRLDPGEGPWTIAVEGSGDAVAALDGDGLLLRAGPRGAEVREIVLSRAD